MFDDGMSYFIEKNLYNKNKEFLDNEIPFTFDLFEYSVALTGDDYSKLKPYCYDELPPLLDRTNDMRNRQKPTGKGFRQPGRPPKFGEF